MRALYKGRTGNDVRYLQYFLGIKVDGSFGAATETAVKNKQRQTGLVVDGSVGPATQKKWGLTDYIVHIYDKDKVWFAGTPYGSKEYPLRTLKQWAALENADRVYNLAFFNSQGSGVDKYGAIRGRTLTYLKAKGKEVGIENGRKQGVSSSGARSRNANGLLKDGRYFQVQSIYNVTEKALVDFMAQNYAVDLLLFQDGGGSTGFYDRTRDALIAPEKEGSNGRPVASVVCVKENKESEVRYCPTCGQVWR
jgi:peptidoglycan hydrolase-like protein with peptidoglycan-binding domain